MCKKFSKLIDWCLLKYDFGFFAYVENIVSKTILHYEFWYSFSKQRYLDVLEKQLYFQNLATTLISEVHLNEVCIREYIS